MSVRALDALTALEAFLNVRLAKAETAPSRKDRDEKQRLHLQEFIDAMRDYYLGFAERIGVEIDTTLPPRETKPQMVNPEQDVRNNKVTKQSPVLKRKTFIGLPTRAPFDLPLDWKKEQDILADTISEQYGKWARFGTGQSPTDLHFANADVDSIKGIAGSLQLGDYDKSIRGSLSKRIVRVTEVQRTITRDIVQRGIDAGLSTKEIANGGKIAGKVYPGIKGTVEQMYRNRSRVIALTESANAYNLGQLEGYKRSGVVTKVRIFDGADCGWTSHDDPDAANGSVRTLEQAQAYPTSHPNCQRSWAPVPLAQTSGVGAGTNPAVPKPKPTGSPKPKVPRTSEQVGKPGTPMHEAQFHEVQDHIFGQRGFSHNLDGTVTKPNGFLDQVSNYPADKAMQRRFQQVMQERYGIRGDIKFPGTAKRIYDAEDLIETAAAFEDYRKLGVGFDDLAIQFSGKTSMRGKMVEWAHFSGTEGHGSGGLTIHGTIKVSVKQARAGLEAKSNFHVTKTGFKSTTRHELGHVVDNRTMGYAGARFRSGYTPKFADPKGLAQSWDDIHRASTRVGAIGDDVAKQTQSIKRTVDELDEGIRNLEALRAAETDPVVRRRLASRILTDKTLRNRYAKQLDDLTNVTDEAFPSGYSTKNFGEDFAESIDLYLDDTVAFRKAYPKRAGVIDDAIEKMRDLPSNYLEEAGIPDDVARYLRLKQQGFKTGPKPRSITESSATRGSQAKTSSTYRALTPDAEFLTPGRVVNIHEPYYKAVQKGVPRTDKPTVRMTGGGPASGKSKAILENPEAGIPNKLKSSHIDPDAAKKAIPEYKQMVNAKDEAAAGIMHEESSHMAKAAVKRALGKDPKTGKVNGTDVVYDSVGDSGIDKLSAKVAKFREQGAARVESDYVTVDVDDAIARQVKRAVRTGRKVDEEVVRSSHADITDTVFGAIDRGTFDKLTLWDNSVPLGHPPIKIAVYTKGAPQPLKILRPDLFDDFAARGSGAVRTPTGVVDDAARIAQEATRTKTLAAKLGDADEAARIVQSQGPKAKAAKVRDLDDLVASPKQEGEGLIDHIKRTKAAKEERAEWARNWQGDIAETLPDDQLAALKAYTEGGYSKTNSGLRGTRPEFIEEARASRETIRAAMTPLDESVQVYRGVKPSALGLDDIDDILSLKPGVEVSDPGFLSTSLSKSTAQSFSRGSGNINLQMRVPAGTRATYVESISSSVGETELILDAGQTLKIVSVTRKVEGGFDVVVDIV